MDIQIDELVIEEDRQVHIKKHDIVIDEVFEVIRGDYLVIEGKLGRSLWLVKQKGNA